MNRIKVGDKVQVVAEEGIGEFEVGEKLIVIRDVLDYVKVISGGNVVDYIHRSKLIKL